MRHPTGVRGALVAAALALTAVPVAAAGGRTAPQVVVKDGSTQPAFSYADAIRETVYVQSTIDGDGDGDLDLLATDIIRPRETADGLRVPVIYEMSPYYQTLGRGNEAETKTEEDGDFVPERFPLYYDNYFVPRGYAMVLQDMRGTRNSEGCMVLGAHEELVDAEATVDWLNGHGKAFTAAGDPVEADWSTGKVGMIGKSYDGSVANGAATTGVEGLTTIVPIAGISRWYDYHLNNGVQYVNAYSTPGLFTFVIDQQPGDDEERGLEWIEATFAENSVCTIEGAAIVEQAADPQADYDAFWDDRDYLKDADGVKASVFVVHGLNDFNVKPNHYVQWWEALAERGVPLKIWLTQTGHVDPFDFRREEWVDTLHRWFDRWLHGIRNGIMSEPMADIERRPDVWRTYGSWPAPRAAPTKLRLNPAKNKRPGVLALHKAAADSFQEYTDDPNQGEDEMVADQFEAKTSRLIFLTRKLDRSLRMSGTPRVKLTASVNRTDTNFTALLVDYGLETRLNHESAGEGIVTTQEESCHGQSTPADDACYFQTEKVTRENAIEIVSRAWLDARHHETLRKGEQLEPGAVYKFKWDIFGEDYIFKKGHRLAIVIAGSDADWTISDPSEATVTVDLRHSRVKLPIVGGRARFRSANN